MTSSWPGASELTEPAAGSPSRNPEPASSTPLLPGHQRNVGHSSAPDIDGTRRGDDWHDDGLSGLPFSVDAGLDLNGHAVGRRGRRRGHGIRERRNRPDVGNVCFWIRLERSRVAA